MEHATPASEAPGVNAGKLDALRFHWGDAYLIAHDRDWWAERRDGKGGRLAAPTADALEKLITADYTFMPVPREVCP